MRKVSAILLGAGQSRRMGFDKLSLPLRGKTVLERSLDALLRSKVREVVVVLGGRTKRLRETLDGLKVRVIINPQYRRGMSTSIRQGLRVISPDSQGIMIALGDQPFLKSMTINALIDAFFRSEKGIVVPSFRGQKGHPVIFHRKYKKELLALRGDAGGKSVVEKYWHDLIRVRTKSEGIVKDLDTLEDYKRLKSKNERERCERGKGD